MDSSNLEYKMSSQGDIVEPYMKRAKHGEEAGEIEKMDHISEMPDSILTYILTMVTTKDAVQTCILSKRWQNLWRYVPTLQATTKHFRKSEFFKRFVPKFLKNRDHEVNLTSVEYEHHGYVRTPVVGSIISYAVTHEVQNLKVRCYINDELHPKLLLFNASKIHCNTLKYLHLSFHNLFNAPVLPVTLEFPELVECRLRYVTFRSMDESVACAEPFSGCKKMRSLSIESCTLRNAKCLVVVGDKLTSLTIWYRSTFPYAPFKVHMRTPNLTSFAYVGPITDDDRLVFEYNQNFLQEARIEVFCHLDGYGNVAQTLCSLLKKCTNVHWLTVSSTTVKILSRVPDFPDAKSLNLGNLRTVTVKLDPKVPCEVASEEMNYLLQDSPMAAVATSTDLPAYCDEIVFGKIGNRPLLYFKSPLGRAFPW